MFLDEFYANLHLTQQYDPINLWHTRLAASFFPLSQPDSCIILIYGCRMTVPPQHLPLCPTELTWHHHQSVRYTLHPQAQVEFLRRCLEIGSQFYGCEVRTITICNFPFTFSSLPVIFLYFQDFQLNEEVKYERCLNQQIVFIALFQTG